MCKRQLWNIAVTDPIFTFPYQDIHDAGNNTTNCHRTERNAVYISEINVQNLLKSVTATHKDCVVNTCGKKICLGSCQIGNWLG